MIGFSQQIPCCRCLHIRRFCVWWVLLWVADCLCRGMGLHSNVLARCVEKCQPPGRTRGHWWPMKELAKFGQRDRQCHSCYIYHPGLCSPLIGCLHGSFVLSVCTSLLLSLQSVLKSVRGGLLRPQPTAAVMLAERLKTHAQMCNSFPVLCLVET